jgi:hypothetical protein
LAEVTTAVAPATRSSSASASMRSRAAGLVISLRAVRTTITSVI